VLTASHADSYVWITTETTDSITVTPQQTTTYSVTGTLNGCSDTANISVIVYPTSTSTSNGTICQGDIFTWNGNHYDTTGIYPLNLLTYHGCDSTLTLNLTVNPKPNVTVTASDTTIIIYSSTTLTVSSDNASDTYQWSPSTGLSCTDCISPMANPEATLSYCVVGTNTFGCSDTACITITVDSDCGKLFLPLAFSPNGDNKNDTWKVQGRCIKSMDLRIFDRWGEKVFETTTPGEGWDGTFRGKALDSDVYVYTLTVTMQDGEEKNFKGDITLLR
jgi:gliding motility-associated-like protein